jgi:hypothetical protein
MLYLNSGVFAAGPRVLASWWASSYDNDTGVLAHPELPLSNSVAANRPSLVDGELVFDGGKSINSINSEVIAPIGNAQASFEFLLRFRTTTIESTQVFMGFTRHGSANEAITIGTGTSNGRLRFQRRNDSGTTRTLESANNAIAPNTDYFVHLRYINGVVNAWLNGSHVIVGGNGIGSTTSMTVDKVALGARVLTSDTVTMNGAIAFAAVRWL